ncbi:MAG TPA: hypothetical protein VHF25_10285, partial [Nitriliruptorales bacterium]|nr:hypothetical protein [Nitriliruptorales bacterium]
RAPRCGGCPVRSVCAWQAAGAIPPDPADGSAGVSRPQAAFHASDRQGRGRLVDALRSGPVALDRVADAAGWPQDRERARRVADALVRDGLARVLDGALVLPG